MQNEKNNLNLHGYNNMYITRNIEKEIHFSLENNPVVAIVGPRQCGKSTTAKQILNSYSSTVYLDLERPSDLSKLQDAEWFFSNSRDSLICVDEVQRRPDLFTIIRSLVDEWRNNGKFLILGSASRDLLQQSAESLAGRIAYKRMFPFSYHEIHDIFGMEHYFERGGFPKSIIPDDLNVSVEWRENFIATFLERDLLQWAGFSSSTMRRLWQMLAHNNGQTINFSAFGKSLGVSHTSIKNYIDLLESTFMVDSIGPYISNMGKRLVKASKVYVSDSGLTASLLGLEGFDQLAGHPAFGSLWEQIVLTNLRSNFPEADFFYYRSSNGAEIDFIMKWKDKILAVECKSTKSPIFSRGNHAAIEDIKPEQTYVVAPIDERWTLSNNIQVVSLLHLITNIRENYS